MNCSDSPFSRLHGGEGHQTASVESTGEDLGQVQHIGVRQLSTESAGNPRISADAALERRLATGRESQRRFRERQKARAQEAERELSKATTELIELRTRQAELEARNLLLEGLRSEQADATQQAAPGLNRAPETDFADSPGIMVLVSQPPYCLTVEEASKLTIPAFSALWTEHVRQLGRLLLQIGNPSALDVQDAVTAMQALAVEAFKLILCLLHNPVTNQALVASRLDDGSLAVNSLDDEFYLTLLNLISLTDDQIQDIIAIRHVYLSRRSSLDRQRKAIVEQMGEQEVQGLHPSDSFAALSRLAEQAHNITAQDFQAYCAVISGLYQGVLSTQQLAGVMVHTYPFLPILVRTLDAVAARGGDIPFACLQDPEQLAAEWRKFEAYVARIRTQVWHDYVPLVVSSGQES